MNSTGLPTLRLGTRGSKLALVQAEHLVSLLHGIADVQLEIIKTQGDKKQDTPRANWGDKRDWILEIEEAVVDGSIDFAVHSAKDVPAEIDERTTLLPVGNREVPTDVLICKSAPRGKSFLEIAPRGALIGTSSLRRKSQLLRLRPDISLIEHRGNVPTRIEKLQQNEQLFGIVLARAGLNRLGYLDLCAYDFSIDEVMPAVNQGILVVQFRKDNVEIGRILNVLVQNELLAIWIAERECVTVLRADCRSAVCVFAERANDELWIRGRILSHDGQQLVERSKRGSAKEAAAIGRALGEELLRNGGEELLRE